MEVGKRTCKDRLRFDIKKRKWRIGFNYTSKLDVRMFTINVIKKSESLMADWKIRKQSSK